MSEFIAASGKIALTASNLRLEMNQRPPFLKGVSVRLKEENGQVWVYVRHNPDSRYSFHQKKNTNQWSVALPRSDFALERNWGSAVFYSQWDLTIDKGFMSYGLTIERLPPVRGSARAVLSSFSERNNAIVGRDRINRLVEKGLLTLNIVDGKLELIFKRNLF